MKRTTLLSLLAGAAVILTPAVGTAFAQDTAPAAPPAGGQGGPGGPGGGQGGRRGNFDPAQFRQRMMERYREQLGIKDDAEWGVIEGRITKIEEARRSSMRGFGGFGGRGPGGPGGPGGGQGNRGGGAPANPDADALQAALDSGASAEEIKLKLTAYREATKKKEAELTKAQDDLRQLLSVKQEASAVLLGLLK